LLNVLLGRGGGGGSISSSSRRKRSKSTCSIHCNYERFIHSLIYR